MTYTTLTPEAVEAAAYGLRFVAERIGLDLHLVDVDKLANAALVHGTKHGFVERSVYDEAEERHKRREMQLGSRAAAAEVALDRKLVTIQAALTKLAKSDPVLAAEIASDVGVMLHV